MQIILFILFSLTFLMGLGIWESAKSAIHEIEAFVMFVVSAVFLSGSAIVGAVNSINETLKKSLSLNPVEEVKPKEDVKPLRGRYDLG